jgi:hypothetical protein
MDTEKGVSKLWAVKHEPVYTQFDWDWLDALSWFDFEGTSCYEDEQKSAMFEILKDIINDIVANHVDENWIDVCYNLVDNDNPDGAAQEFFSVTIGREYPYTGGLTFQQHMPRYPMFDKNVYSALTMFAYTVTDAVRERSSIQSINGPRQY